MANKRTIVIVPAGRNYFRHYKGEPLVRITEEIMPAVSMIDNICETSRDYGPLAWPPVCNCGKYALRWEQ